MTQNFVDSTFSTLWRNEKQFEEAEKRFSAVQPKDQASFFYQMLRKKKLLPTLDAKSRKSNVEATRLKKLGDDAFCRKDDASAVEWYTRSVAVAVAGSSLLTRAYVNRSAALFRLGSYASCLKDIKRATDDDGNCDPKLRQQLLKRELSCTIQLAMKRIKGNIVRKEMPTISSGNTNSEDSAIPNATNKLKMALGPEYGRHLIATREIKPGEVLCIEKPFASVLSLDSAYSHCANCFSRCDSLIACPTCTLVMFCTTICQKSAYNRFHRTECEIIDHVRNFGIKDNSWLAIRMLMVASNQGAQVETMMKHSIFRHPMKRVTDVLPSTNSGDYANIHNLEDHVEERCFDYPNGLVAALLLHILKHSSFFDSSKNVSRRNEQVLKAAKTDSYNLNEDSDSLSRETFVGTLLLKFLLVIECNAFRIFETVDHASKATPAFLKKQIGFSIYSFHSYFNHSCDENATLDFYNDTIVTRAIQLIYPGQQICINYYRSFNNCRRENREKYLNERYYFRCTCIACEENWPRLEDTGSVSVLPKLKVNSISIETLRHYLSRSLILRQKNPLLFDDRLTGALCEYVAIIQKSIKMPFKEYYECQEKLRQVFATQANFYSDITRAAS